MGTYVSNQAFFATVAEKSHGTQLRGDYSHADANYVVQQDCSLYTEQEHALWRKLYQRQQVLLEGRACDEFIEALHSMKAADHIPDLAQTSKELMRATGWQLVAVPGLIPDLSFFEHLAHRRFPVSVWLRTQEEFDYIVEPDIFHDFFGHVPLLFNPIFADYLQRFGQGGLKAVHEHALENLARLYWYTVEFGLIQTAQGLRIYGAGILSSGGEMEYCLRQDTGAHHLPLNIERIMRTLYKIDSFQESYFVIESFQQLFDLSEQEFHPIYERLKHLPSIAANQLLDDEV